MYALRFAAKSALASRTNTKTCQMLIPLFLISRSCVCVLLRRRTNQRRAWEPMVGDSSNVTSVPAQSKQNVRYKFSRAKLSMCSTYLELYFFTVQYMFKIKLMWQILSRVIHSCGRFSFFFSSFAWVQKTAEKKWKKRTDTVKVASNYFSLFGSFLEGRGFTKQKRRVFFLFQRYITSSIIVRTSKATVFGWKIFPQPLSAAAEICSFPFSSPCGSPPSSNIAAQVTAKEGRGRQRLSKIR